MTTTAETTPTQRTTWTIDPSHSLVEFSAKHMMFTTVKGRFTGVRGSIAADESNPANSSVEVTIDAASLTSGDEKRDGHLKSPDFLDVATYPEITFKSTRVQPLDDAGDKLRVVGDLAVHGVTKEVVLDTEKTGVGKTPFGTEVAGFSATTSLNRKDWGLNWNVALEAGGVLVGETVKLALDLVDARASDGNVTTPRGRRQPMVLEPSRDSRMMSAWPAC